MIARTIIAKVPKALSKRMSSAAIMFTQPPHIYYRSMHSVYKRPQMSSVLRNVRFNHITTNTDGTEVPADVLNLTDNDYYEHSTSAFDIINDELDAFFEENRIMEAEVDEDAGVMHINVSEGTYVINKQPPTKQIWLSSPVSGPKRFDFHNGSWISLRDNVKLSDLLQDEITRMYGNFEWTTTF